MFIIFSRTIAPISTKLGTKHSYVIWIQVSKGEIITQKRKYFDKNLKSSYPEPLGQFQANMTHSRSYWVKGIALWHRHTKLGTWMYHHEATCCVHSWPLLYLDLLPKCRWHVITIKKRFWRLLILLKKTCMAFFLRKKRCFICK